MIASRQVVRGFTMTGGDCRVGPNAYIGPYTAVGDRCHISFAEVDDSIVMDDTRVEVPCKLMRSMIGKGSKVLSAKGLIPSGTRLIIGENTTLYL